jgi:hypothetical protein
LPIKVDASKGFFELLIAVSIIDFIIAKEVAP